MRRLTLSIGLVAGPCVAPAVLADQAVALARPADPEDDTSKPC